MGEILVSGPVGMPQLLYDQISEAIREQGFEPVLKEETGVEERSAGGFGLLMWELLLWSRDHLAGPTALMLASGVAKAIGRWRKERGVKAPRRPCASSTGRTGPNSLGSRSPTTPRTESHRCQRGSRNR
jgi:hypothetical protein